MFPSISTGIYGFPVARAAPLALRELRAGLRAHAELERVPVVCFSGSDLRHYEAAKAQILEEAG